MRLRLGFLLLAHNVLGLQLPVRTPAAYWELSTSSFGVAAPKTVPRVFGELRGIAATEAISSGEDLITVPSKSSITVTTDQTKPKELTDVENAYWTKCRWFVRLALLLLAERSKGRNSPLQPYIEQLPEAFETPLHWTAEELSAACYEHLTTAVETQRREWSAAYNELRSTSPSWTHSEEDFVWACEVVHSRAFSGPYEGRGPKERLAEIGFVTVLAGLSLAANLGTFEQVTNGVMAVLISIPLRDFFMSKLVPELRRYALMPCIDFINHRSAAPSTVSYDYFFDRFAVVSREPWDAGEQVFISYGDRSNDDLLQYYAFVEPANPFDDYQICDFPTKLEEALGADLDTSKRSLLSRATDLRARCPSVTLTRTGLAPGKATAEGSRKKTDVPPPALPLLRLAVLTDDHLPAGSPPLGLGDLEKEISPENEAAATAAMAAVAAAELARISRPAAPPPRSEERARLAEELRVEKQAVLAEAVASLRAAAGIEAPPVPAELVAQR